jgi:hypothetical protein
MNCMGDGVTALIFGVGAGTWTYGRLMRTTNNTQSSLTGGAAVGLVGFVVVFTLLKYVFHF